MELYSANITIMMKAAEKAAKALVRDFGELEKLQVSQKAPLEFVSNADRKAEKIILKELTTARPTYGVLSEESEEIKGEGKYRWIVDPIDGTLNFLHAIPMFCTTIALEEIHASGRREIIAAVTSAPILKGTFWAEKGQGVWLAHWEQSGSERLRVASRKNLSDTLLGLGSLETDRQYFNKIADSVLSVRCLGSTALALAYVAAGNIDCFIQKNVKPWNVAAGMLMINEAGGFFSDDKGRGKVFESGNIVASNEILHDKILKKLK